MKKIFVILLLFTTNCFAAPQALDKLTVILDWFPNPDHAPLVIAKQQGFFKEQGLEVNLIGPADPTDPPKWVAAGKADIGITYEPEFMQQVDRGLPLIRFGTLIDKPLNCLVALKDSGISDLNNLKGKKIGSSTSGLSEVMLKVLLNKQGLTDKDIELVNVHYNLTQALLSHKVDMVTGMMRNFEVPQLESMNHEVVAFFPEEHGVPTYSELVFITNTAKIHDNRLPRFLAAITKAVAYLDAHPKETWKLFSKEYPEADNAINHQAWFATMPYFAEDPGSFSREEWKNFANFMHENQLITKIQPVSRYAVEIG